jgi:uncharacterized protein
MTADVRKLRAVPFTNVTIEDNFWAPRIKANREQTLAASFEQLKKTGRLDALKLNWKPGHEPKPHIFWDSDVAKWLEAACYSLTSHQDARLAAQVDEVVKLLCGLPQQLLHRRRT